jgi:hypothetical protein
MQSNMVVYKTVELSRVKKGEVEASDGLGERKQADGGAGMLQGDEIDEREGQGRRRLTWRIGIP